MGKRLTRRLQHYVGRWTALAVAICLLQGATASGQHKADVIDRSVVLEEIHSVSIGKRQETVFRTTGLSGSFTGIALQGFADGNHLDGLIRFRDRSVWSDWQPLFIVQSVTDPSFFASFRGDDYLSTDAFEVSFTMKDAGEPMVVAGGVFDELAELEEAGQSDTFTPYAPDVYPGLIIPPLLNRRTAWGATPFIGDPIPLARPDYRYITFHHAAGFGAVTYEEGLQQVKAIQTFHQEGRGWSDIGYHFVFDEIGNLYQGRPFLDEGFDLEDVPRLVQGAHAGGANTGNIGVCVLGCYDPPWANWCTDVLSDAALDSLTTMVGFLADAYGIAPENIRGHRDFGNTACPGENNYKLLPEIRQRVEQLILTGNQPLGRARMETSISDAGVVLLDWEVTEDNGIAAFRIDRVYSDSAYTVATGIEPGSRSWTDSDVDRPGSLAYRLYATDLDGRDFFLSSVEVTIDTPIDYVLAQAYPNPFTSSANIRYFVRDEGYVKMDIVDSGGRMLSTIVNEFQEGDRWYHAALSGQGLATGVYFVHLLVEGYNGIAFEKVIPIALVR